MERLDYPNSSDKKSTDEQLRVIRGFLNELVDVLNYNFEQIENAINGMAQEGSEE